MYLRTLASLVFGIPPRLNAWCKLSACASKMAQSMSCPLFSSPLGQRTEAAIKVRPGQQPVTCHIWLDTHRAGILVTHMTSSNRAATATATATATAQTATAAATTTHGPNQRHHLGGYGSTQHRTGASQICQLHGRREALGRSCVRHADHADSGATCGNFAFPEDRRKRSKSMTAATLAGSTYRRPPAKIKRPKLMKTG